MSRSMSIGTTTFGPACRMPYWPSDVHWKTGVAHGPAAIPGVARRALHLDALAERQRDRGLGLLGVDHRALDVGQHVGREVPPLREEDPAARLLEVAVDGDRERRDVAAVAVDRDEVLEAVMDERVADLAEDLRNVVVVSRMLPGNCMWYHESVTLSVGATRTRRPSSAASWAVRVASAWAITQSVSSGMCGPCCSVVPIGSSTASTPASICSPDLLPRHPLDQVLRHGRLV